MDALTKIYDYFTWLDLDEWSWNDDHKGQRAGGKPLLDGTGSTQTLCDYSS